MSLESGVILLRLNQELLPEPGRPMARMTAPLGGRGMAGGGGCKVAFSGTAGVVGAPGGGGDGGGGAGEDGSVPPEARHPRWTALPSALPAVRAFPPYPLRVRTRSLARARIAVVIRQVGRQHQSRQVVTAPARVRRACSVGTSCDASGGRSSICACRACNTGAAPRAISHARHPMACKRT